MEGREEDGTEHEKRPRLEEVPEPGDVAPNQEMVETEPTAEAPVVPVTETPVPVAPVAGPITEQPATQE